MSRRENKLTAAANELAEEQELEHRPAESVDVTGSNDGRLRRSSDREGQSDLANGEGQ